MCNYTVFESLSSEILGTTGGYDESLVWMAVYCEYCLGGSTFLVDEVTSKINDLNSGRTLFGSAPWEMRNCIYSLVIIPLWWNLRGVYETLWYLNVSLSNINSVIRKVRAVSPVLEENKIEKRKKKKIEWFAN